MYLLKKWKKKIKEYLYSLTILLMDLFWSEFHWRTNWCHHYRFVISYAIHNNVNITIIFFISLLLCNCWLFDKYFFSVNLYGFPLDMTWYHYISSMIIIRYLIGGWINNLKVKVLNFELHLFLLSWIRNFQKGEELKYFKRYISTI